MNDLSDDFVDALRWKAVEDLGYSREKIEQNQKIVDVILPLIFADQYDESGYVEATVQHDPRKTLYGECLG